jgi:hypothetical protein
VAEELASQAAASAPVAVSSPLSSPAPAPSTSAAVPAATAASPQTPASPVTTSQTPATEVAAARPEGIPDSYWDSATNALKVDPAALAKDLRERDELKTFKASEDSRRLSLPQKAEDYKLELPSDFKAPEGIEYKLDAANPALANLRAVAHKHGITQDAVKELLGVYAGNEVGTQQAIATAKAAEIAKLGTTAPARVDAVVNWLTGMDGSADKGDAKALAGMLVTARHVEAFERIMNKFSSQGTASFSQSHRTAPETNGIPGYEKMTFEQRRQAQDNNAARRSN